MTTFLNGNHTVFQLKHLSHKQQAKDSIPNLDRKPLSRNYKNTVHKDFVYDLFLKANVALLHTSKNIFPSMSNLSILHQFSVVTHGYFKFCLS